MNYLASKLMIFDEFYFFPAGRPKLEVLTFSGFFWSRLQNFMSCPKNLGHDSENCVAT